MMDREMSLLNAVMGGLKSENVQKMGGVVCARDFLRKKGNMGR